MKYRKTLLKEIAQKDFVTLKETATIANAASVFQREGIEAIVVLNSNPRLIKGISRLHLEKLITDRTDPSLPLRSIVAPLSVMDENLPILDIPQVSWPNPSLIATVNSQGKLKGIVTQNAFMKAYWHDTRFLLGMLSDELESTKNRLKDNEATLETMKMVFEDAIEGIVMVDQDGIVQYVNQRCAESMGHTRESALGKHVSDFTDDTHLPYILKTGKPTIGAIVKSPTQGNMVASGYPLRRDGKVIGAVGIVLFSGSQKLRDLTKKIDILEERIRRYKKELKGHRFSRYTFDNIVGRSEGINRAKRLARKAANSSFPVIIKSTGDYILRD